MKEKKKEEEVAEENLWQFLIYEDDLLSLTIIHISLSFFFAIYLFIITEKLTFPFVYLLPLVHYLINNNYLSYEMMYFPQKAIEIFFSN